MRVGGMSEEIGVFDPELVMFPFPVTAGRLDEGSGFVEVTAVGWSCVSGEFSPADVDMAGTNPIENRHAAFVRFELWGSISRRIASVS